MVKFLIKHLAIALLFLMMVSCEKNDDDPSSSNESSIAFIKIGNCWEYEYQAGEAGKMLYVQKITGTDQQGNFIVETTFAGLTHHDIRWETTDDYFADTPGFPLYYVCGTKGQKWDSPEPDEEMGYLSREIVALQEEVTVIAGTFENCQLVKQTFANDSNEVYHFWISPKTGLVKQVGTGWIDDGTTRQYFDVTLQLKSINF